MHERIETYLEQLKKALAGADPATVQDAAADAAEHLTTAFEQARADNPETDEKEMVKMVIENYGPPEEVADAYRDLEARTTPTLAPVGNPNGRSLPARFFGVMIDIRAYAALLYMLFSLVLGIVYFTWAVTGISMSMGLIILIIGFPFFVIFLLSVRGIALLEGRIVEAILGERMPRRPEFIRKDLGFWGRIKFLFTDRTTWTTLLYMILMLPLGTAYFSVFITLIAVSLSSILRPVLEHYFDLPFMTINNCYYYTPAWGMPLMVIGGILMLIVTMHFAGLLGRFQGRLAKALLVKHD